MQGRPQTMEEEPATVTISHKLDMSLKESLQTMSLFWAPRINQKSLKLGI